MFWNDQAIKTLVKTNRIVRALVLLMVLVFLSACDEKADKIEAIQNDLQTSMFSTNGELFAFNRAHSVDQPVIEIMDINGLVKKQISFKNYHASFGVFGKNGFYFNKYDSKNKYSYLNYCKLDFETCNVIFDAPGAIRSPLELDNGDVLFAYSEYKEALNKYAGYIDFDLYYYNRLKNTTEQLTLVGNKQNKSPFKWLSDQSFLILSAIRHIDGKLYMTVEVKDVFLKKLKILHRGLGLYSQNTYKEALLEFYIDQENNARVSGNTIIPDKTTASIIDEFKYGKYKIYYLAKRGATKIDPTKKQRVSQVCVVKNSLDDGDCKNTGVTTTRPALHDGKLYYGTWDYELEKLNIKMVDLGE